MTETQLTDKRLAKVAALLRKAESTTPAEAEALQEKAAELLAAWGLDELRVRALAGETVAADDPFEDEVWEVKVSSMAKAHGELAYRLAEGCNLKGVYWGQQTKHKVRIRVFGRRSDLARARLLRASVTMQLGSALKAWTQEQLDEEPHLKGTWALFVEQRSFVLAYSSALTTRLARARKHAEQAATDKDQTATPINREDLALAIRDEHARRDDYVAERCGKLGKMRSTSVRQATRGIQAGYAAGARADVGSSKLQTGPKAIGR